MAVFEITICDLKRSSGTPHPMMKAYGIDAVPFQNGQLDHWRDALRGGISYLHEPTRLILAGGIDDLWVNPAGQLHIVDYKSTAKEGEVTLERTGRPLTGSSNLT